MKFTWSARYAQGAVILLITSLCMTFLFFRPTAGQTGEGVTCSPEPTDMSITYGSVITCTLETENDTDTFRFAGSAGDKIILQVVHRAGSMRPCVELIAPDNTHTPLCNNAFTNRIDTTLAQTGQYSAVVDVFFLGTGDYTLTLERIIPPSANAGRLSPGSPIVGTIDPEGDLDLFFFEAAAGTLATIKTDYEDGDMRPCIQLIQPDNSRLTACNNAFSNQINTTLPLSGTYTVLADVFFTGVGTYTLSLSSIPIATSTPTATPTANPTKPTMTPTATHTPIASPTASSTATTTPTPTSTSMPSATATGTATPTPLPSLTATATPTFTPTFTPTNTPTMTSAPQGVPTSPAIYFPVIIDR